MLTAMIGKEGECTDNQVRNHQYFKNNDYQQITLRLQEALTEMTKSLEIYSLWQVLQEISSYGLY